MGDNTTPVIESDSWCRTTRGDQASTTFTWTIEDYFNRPEKTGDYIKSSTFTVTGPNDKVTTWELRLYPKGDMDDADKVGLFLASKNDSFEKVSSSLSILNERLEREISKNMTAVRYKELFDNTLEAVADVGFSMISIEQLRDSPQLLPNGNLTVVCDLTVFGPEVTVCVRLQVSRRQMSEANE